MLRFCSNTRIVVLNLDTFVNVAEKLPVNARKVMPIITDLHCILTPLPFNIEYSPPTSNVTDHFRTTR